MRSECNVLFDKMTSIAHCRLSPVVSPVQPSESNLIRGVWPRAAYHSSMRLFGLWIPYSDNRFLMFVGTKLEMRLGSTMVAARAWISAVNCTALL
jgi:hypothetical protein